ncbi:hypothetical protein [Tomitella gaofuii]|nr:hypothetical protein [Tomitella gaofuii]
MTFPQTAGQYLERKSKTLNGDVMILGSLGLTLAGLVSGLLGGLGSLLGI